MIRFVAGRLAQMTMILLLMSFLVYVLIGLMPGDPIDLMISSNPELTAADAARLKALHGLDQPILQRYRAWLGQAMGGDLGYSRLHARPVLDILAPALVNTIVLMGAAFILSVAISLPAGILAALRPASWTDYAVNLACFAGISVPPFWLALMMITLFSVMLGILPASAVSTAPDPGLWDQVRHLAMPVLTLGLLSAGGVTRYVRASMREALRQDFVRTAAAKGMGRARLVLRHALPNALIPVITILALDVGALFSGALITEIMFAYPGMGKLLFDSIMGNDYNLALVGLLFSTLVTLLCNFGADLGYVALDPRVTLAATGDRG